MILKFSLKLKDHYLINDKSIISRLIKDIGNYLDIFFKTFPLSSRINISYQENMKQIKPCYSFILVPDEKFKTKYKFNEYLNKNKNIEEHILSYDVKLKRIYSLKMVNTLFSSKRKLPSLINKLNNKANSDDLNDDTKLLLENKKNKKNYKIILK